MVLFPATEHLGLLGFLRPRGGRSLHLRSGGDHEAVTRHVGHGMMGLGCGVSWSRGEQQHFLEVSSMENPMKMNDLGDPHFRKPPFWGERLKTFAKKNATLGYPEPLEFQGEFLPRMRSLETLADWFGGCPKQKLKIKWKSWVSRSYTP